MGLKFNYCASRDKQELSWIYWTQCKLDCQTAVFVSSVMLLEERRGEEHCMATLTNAVLQTKGKDETIIYV